PSHTSDPVAAFRDAPEDLVRIFLAHQPKTLKLTDSVQFDLMLSGHTHGGQFFPWNLATTLDQPYLSGLHRPDGKWIYVSKGTGYWGPPVRLGARSEITVVTLTGGNAA
ncbi:MAG: metallophosphoesterase, partial [Bacteroidota bacterium]